MSGYAASLRVVNVERGLRPDLGELDVEEAEEGMLVSGP